jgi:O-antigen ligase
MRTSLNRIPQSGALPQSSETPLDWTHRWVAQTRPLPPLLQWSFLLFVFTIPLESADLGINRGSLSLARMVGLFFFGFCVLHHKRCFLFPPLPLWLFMGYLVFYLVNGLFIQDIYFRMFLTRTITFVQLYVFFWIGSTLMRDENLTRKALLSYSLSTIFMSLGTRFGLPGFSSETLKSSVGERITTLDYNPNYLSLILALSAVILVGLRLDKNTRSLWAKWTLVFSVLIVLGFMVKTGSRAGICAFVVGVSFYLLPLGRTRRRMVAVAMGMSALIMVAVLVARDPDALGRWTKMVVEGNTSGRDEIYSAAIQLIAEQPFSGYGPIESQEALNLRLRGSEGMQDPHSLPLHLLLEVGLIGAFPFFLGLLVCVYYAWKGRNGPLGVMPLSLLATMLVGLLFHTWMTNKPLWLVLATSCASGFIRNNSRVKQAQAWAYRMVRP